MKTILTAKRIFFIAISLIQILSFITPVSGQIIGWNKVTTPDTSSTRNMLRGISGTSSSDVWVAGSFEETPAYPPYNIQKNLLIHWNGQTWTFFPTASLSTTLTELWDVEALSATDVYAVGDYNEPNVHAQLIKYNGSSWSNIPLPAKSGGSFLYSLDAISPTDIWAAGGQGTPGTPLPRTCYTLHYNGSSWTEINVPAVGSFRNAFNSIDGITSNDVWAVGHKGENYGDYHGLVMHWNGSTWQNSVLPPSVDAILGELLSVKMISSNDVWAVGYALTGGAIQIHWNGSSWSEVPFHGGGGAFAPLAANDIYQVGGTISHWDGSNWTVVDSLSQSSYPSLVSAVVFANGEIWSAGRTVDNNNHFYTLVYRSVNHTPSFINGGTQNLNSPQNSQPVSLSGILQTQDADQSQVLTYSVVTPPAHGTLTGFPTTAVTSNGNAAPNGVAYTPVAGYTGADQFVIQVAAGQVYSRTTVNVNVGGAVPVTLTDFSLRKEGNSTVLHWKTSTEVNTDRFEIEHSVDGKSYSSIGSVRANGNSNIEKQYSTTHFSPIEGENFYRIRVVDKDGKTMVSPVRSIRFTAGDFSSLRIYPNPVTAGLVKIHMAAKAGTYSANIYDHTGRLLYSTLIIKSTGIEDYSFTIPGYLKAGAYSLVIEKPGVIISQKLFIR